MVVMFLWKILYLHNVFFLFKIKNILQYGNYRFG